MKRYGVWFEPAQLFTGAGFRVHNDYTDCCTGDFSVLLRAEAEHAHAVCTPSVPIAADSFSLYIIMKADRALSVRVSVGIHQKTFPVDMQYQTYEWNIPGGGFDRLELSFTGGSVWLDDLYVEHDGVVQGTIKKSIGQRIAEVRQTASKRIFETFLLDISNYKEEHLNQYFDMLWVNQDVESVNTRLTAYFERETARKLEQGDVHWSIIDAYLPIMDFYFCFGTHGSVAPGRLYPGTQRALLAYLWVLMEVCNDVHIAKQNTWYINSSENHDIGHKAACLLSSMIFMHEPGYQNRVYPNLGRGFHWQKQSLLTPVKEKTITEEYRPREQYEAWVAFFHEYFAERAKKGFFIERASNGYMKWTLGSILGIFTFVEDEALREKARMFLDIVWADWAQEQFHGVRGGVKTRHHYTAGENGVDAMSTMATFLMGGPGNATLSYKQMLLAGYELPEVVWKMALDRKGMGDFTYLSRGIVEENPALPRPAGCGHTMITDVESRCVRVSWVTPSYILASQLEHPRCCYTHLATGGRWMGLVTPELKARIVPVGLDPSSRLSPNGERYSTDLVCSAVQHQNVLIFQQRRRWMQANPAMFPAYDDVYERPMGLYIGTAWEQCVHRDGVLFLHRGDTYVSIRIILCLMDNDPLAWAKGTAHYADDIVLDDMPYTWEQEGDILRLKSRYSPVILEAGDTRTFPSLEDFIASILDNPPTLIPTVVKREAGVIIRYKGLDSQAKELLYNAANVDEIPYVGGKPVDYCYPCTFDSPYLQSVYGSGIIKAHFDGNNEVYDFTI